MRASPISGRSPVMYPGPPPAAADVVVIGGGVIGVTTALYLAEAGQAVVLLEKGRIAGEQSSRNWGWIRKQARDAAELPIMVEAQARWQELAQQTNIDFGLRQAGVTYFADTAKQVAEFEAWTAFAEANGVDTRMLSPGEVSTMFPGLAKPKLGAMVTASDMRAEPWLAVPALAGIAKRAGAQIVENCAVRALDLAAGAVRGVVTEAGTIKADRVVLAGGAWSALFLRNHGVDLPQLAVRQSVLATQTLPQVHAGAAADSRIAFRRRLDGGYTLALPGSAELYIGPDAFRAMGAYMPQLRADPRGQSYRLDMPRDFPDGWRTTRRWDADSQSPFERMRVLDPRPNTRHIKRMTDRFAELYPGLPGVTVKAAWAGMIDTMPDVVPVVDHCGQIPGLVIGTGMSGHGFGIGPGMGRVLCALVMNDDPGHDLARFRATRFSDGSPIRLGPLI